MDKYLISIIGAKNSGKSTSAQIIKDLIQDSTEIAIADKLKVELSLAYDLDLIHFHSQELKEQRFLYPLRTTLDKMCHMIEAFSRNPVRSIPYELIQNIATMEMYTPRELMQQWGTEFLRKLYGDNVHCENTTFQGKSIIVSDVRFKNEFNYVSRLKGFKHIPIYIENKEAEKKADNDGHISEQEYKTLRNRCFRIDNNEKSLYKLARSINDLLGKQINA